MPEEKSQGAGTVTEEAPGENTVQIFLQRLLGIQVCQRLRGFFVKINRAVLLAAAADGEDFAEGDAVFFHFSKHQIERVGPEQRGAVFDERVAVGEDAVPGFIFREGAVEIEGFFVNDFAGIKVNPCHKTTSREGVLSDHEIPLFPWSARTAATL